MTLLRFSSLPLLLLLSSLHGSSHAFSLMTPTPRNHVASSSSSSMDLRMPQPVVVSNKRRDLLAGLVAFNAAAVFGVSSVPAFAATATAPAPPTAAVAPPGPSATATATAPASGSVTTKPAEPATATTPVKPVTTATPSPSVNATTATVPAPLTTPAATTTPAAAGVVPPVTTPAAPSSIGGGLPTSPFGGAGAGGAAKGAVLPNPGNTKNCKDFATYSEAKAWYDTYFPLYGDVAELDGDKNGIPCEKLPGAPKKKKA